MNRNILAILPTAGRNKRFWPLKNKHFLTFIGQPLIHYILINLQKHGFRNILLVVNSENKNQALKLKTSFPELSIEITQQSGDGIGAAILSCEKKITGPVAIMAPHDVVEDKLFAEFEGSINKNPQALVVAKQMTEYFPGGYLKIENNVISRIIEKPAKNKRPSDTIALLYYYFREGNELIDALKITKTTNDDQFERAVSLLLKQGLKMTPLFYRGFWGYVKYPWDILKLTQFFLKKIKPTIGSKARIDKRAIITGKVNIGDNVIIHPFATIQGPSFIGDNTVIGHYTLIRQAHIGRGCVVGFASEISRSYVGNNCWFHNTYVGDSIIGENVSLGAGAILANLRLDEGEISSLISGKKLATGLKKLGAIIGNHVRIGVNSSLMPGVKIGTNSVLGPGVIVDKDIAENMAYFVSQKAADIKTNAIDIKKLVRGKVK